MGQGHSHGGGLVACDPLPPFVSLFKADNLQYSGGKNWWEPSVWQCDPILNLCLMNYQYFLLNLVNSDIIFSISFEKCLVSHMHDPHSQHSHVHSQFKIVDLEQYPIQNLEGWKFMPRLRVKTLKEKKNSLLDGTYLSRPNKEILLLFPLPLPLSFLLC